MFCTVCQKDLAHCTCPDLEERVNRLTKNPTLKIDPEYEQRIRDYVAQQEKGEAAPAGKKDRIKIELLHAVVEGVDFWRWQREDGAWVSPAFSTMEAAYYMAGRMPFLDDAQWKAMHPVPKNPKLQ